MPVQRAADAERSRERSTDRVYDQVKLMAVTYQFRPGERINEIGLAGRLKVSRTPLREALNRLVSEGFLTVLHNRGFFGRMLDAKEIFDLYEFRCETEQTIARLVCARASDQALVELGELARQRPEEEEGKSLAALQHDEAFHLGIASLTGNREFMRSLEAINSRIHFIRWIDLKATPYACDTGHLKLVQLLRTRDPEACSAYVGVSLRRRYDEIVQFIRTGIAEIYVGPNDPND